MGSVVEIRVHGVGGEPPSGMTRDPHPILIGGDERTGFYRGRNPIVGQLTAPGSPPNGERPLHVREALSWGGQTSGTFRHAFWVLLLPFALFNAAGRMHHTRGPVWGRIHRAVCRVLALSMTLVVVGIACGLTFDLLAVQCGGMGERCLGSSSDGPFYLAPLRFFVEDVVGRLGLAASAPIALVLALWYAGRYSTLDLEGYTTDLAVERDEANDEPVSLAEPDFWRNAWPTSRLRALHATAAFAWIGGTLALAIQVVEIDLERDPHPAWAGLAIASAAVVVVSLVVAGLPSMVTPGPNGPLHRTLAALRLVGLGALGVAVGGAVMGPVMPGPVWNLFPWVPSGTAGLVGVFFVVWWARAAFFENDERSAPNISIARANARLTVGALLVGGGAGGLARWLPTDSPFVGGLLGDAASYEAPVLGAVAGISARLPGWLSWLRELIPNDLFSGLFAAPYVPPAALALVQAGLLAVLLIVALDKAPTPRPDASQLDKGHPVRRNLAALVVALLCLLLIVAVGAGVHALVLEALGIRVAAAELDPTTATDVQLTLPWWHGVAALVGASLLIPVVVGWPVLRRQHRSRSPEPDDVATYLRSAYEQAHIEPAPTQPTDDDRLKDIGGAWMTQWLIRRAGDLLLWLVASAGIVTVVLVVYLVRHKDGFGAGLPGISVAMWVVTAIPVGAMALIRSSLRDRRTRREVGRLWDVLTFWPRVTHPFAPPCYGEALVPMLEQRVRSLLEPPSTSSHHDNSPGTESPRTGRPRGYRVILAGHSQGSVIALAAAARLDATAVTEPDAGRQESRETAAHPPIALVSYGSPIAILYERFFRPTYAAGAGETQATLYNHVLARVDSWHHWFALTEPFAVPFWAPLSKREVTDSNNIEKGWPVNLEYPNVNDADCLGCRRDAGTKYVDALVRDPERWHRWGEYHAMRPAGHSTYHQHPDVDSHLARIANSMV